MFFLMTGVFFGLLLCLLYQLSAYGKIRGNELFVIPEGQTKIVLFIDVI